jgi:DNA helicase-2/ATP-dependent DNA helicase PcrA
MLRESGEEEDADRLANVEELVTAAKQFHDEDNSRTITDFLEQITLASDVDGWDEQADHVSVMTLHSSKGLEFPVVFVAGLEEGMLPHALAVEEGSEEGVEEERRLLYVGMTRAMDELTLTYARMRMHFGETSWQTPSRFLAEIPREWSEGLATSDDAADEGPVYVAEEEAACEELSAGQRVEHEHFGYGTVELVRGSGPRALVTVRFASAGTRVLLAQYAKLRVVR